MRPFNVVRWIVWKDLLCEIRNREGIASMLFFALNVVLVFSFSFSMGDLREIMPGLIWTAFGFTAVIGLGKSFLPEAQNDCIESYQMLPGPKGAVYLGKLLGNALFLFLVELALVPLLVLFLNLEFPKNGWLFLPILALGTVGLAALGTLFSALTVQVRARGDVPSSAIAAVGAGLHRRHRGHARPARRRAVFVLSSLGRDAGRLRSDLYRRFVLGVRVYSR